MSAPRDGVITSNGLTAEFRFIAGDLVGAPMSLVETATGQAWIADELLEYDPPKDLSPEAAAVVEASKEAK